MAKLTTHVLDTVRGGPAAGVRVRLYAAGGERMLVSETETNADGRTDGALLEGDAFVSGSYDLEFDIGEYFRSAGAETADPAFLETVVIRVGLDGAEDYHVPLLTSPWSYSTYRGS